MRLLLAEDDDPKRANLRQFLSSDFPCMHVEVSRSVRSTIDAIRATPPDALLLDMSLPTFDIGGREGGGRPQSAGGIEVLDFLSYAELALPTIIVTQHEAFDYNGKTVSVAALIQRLHDRFPHSFFGLVQYNTISGLWRTNLATIIRKLLGARSEDSPG